MKEIIYSDYDYGCNSNISVNGKTLTDNDLFILRINNGLSNLGNLGMNELKRMFKDADRIICCVNGDIKIWDKQDMR